MSSRFLKSEKINKISDVSGLESILASTKAESTTHVDVDGSRAMTGDLNLGTNNITNVGLVDGKDVSELAYRVNTLLRDGSQTMAGDFNVGDNDIVGVGLVDGVDVAAANIKINNQVYASGTTILTGGVLSVNADNTKFDVSDGTGLIYNDSTDALESVSWTGKTALTVTNLATNLITFVKINSNGDIIQQTTPFSEDDYHDFIIIGVVVHVNLTNVDTVNQEHGFAKHATLQLHQYMKSIGFISEGNIFSAVGGNLQIQKSLGYMIGPGLNYFNSIINANKLKLLALNPATFQYRYQDGSNGITGNLIIPGEYDNGNGAGSPGNVPNNQYSVQRIYCFSSNNVKIQPGQFLYSTIADAQASLTTEAFTVEPSISSNGMFRGYLIVKGNAGSLNIATQAQFIEASKFGDASSASGLSTTTLQGAYDNSTSGTKIITNSTLGGVCVELDSGQANTENLLCGFNNLSSETFSVTGDGIVTCTGLNNVTSTEISQLEGIGANVLNGNCWTSLANSSAYTIQSQDWLNLAASSSYSIVAQCWANLASSSASTIDFNDWDIVSQLGTFTSDEIAQLKNINTSIIDAQCWANLSTSSAYSIVAQCWANLSTSSAYSIVAQCWANLVSSAASSIDFNDWAIVSELGTFTSDEITQLKNIDATTISSTQWGYLGALNQSLTQTSSPTFATINTGQGNNNLYDMNQNVLTSSKPTFEALSIKGSVSVDGSDTVIYDGTHRAYKQIYLEQPQSSLYGWSIGNQSQGVVSGDNDFYFMCKDNVGGAWHIAGYVADTNVSTLPVSMNFTGQHRCVSNFNYNDDMKGLIVSSTGKYQNFILDENCNCKNITINDALPIVELCNIPNDKKIFGVISGVEEERKYEAGTFVSLYNKKEGDNRIFINGLGEGGIWVSNVNGNLQNGDYICSWQNGYGQKQNDDLYHNYTVAKITMDCDFNPVPEPIKIYDGYDETNSEIIWKNKLDASGNVVYEHTYEVKTLDDGTKVAFVGCIYLCS